jgi:uncharacterized protein
MTAKPLRMTTGVAAAMILLILVIPLPAARAANDKLDLPQIFKKMDVMIPMRDGVRLHTEIYIPRHATGPLPFIFERTPYGLNDDDRGYSQKFSIYTELVRQGYIFVFQDIRGRYKSGGKFVMMRPPRDRSDPKAIDESTDTYDTIDWLLKHVPGNNRRAGILGISYGGWLTTMALLDPHPALKAVSEQASPADMFLGDDFHHNGAFRLSYGFFYSTMMETSKTNYHFSFDRHDVYEWYLLNLGPLSNVNAEYLHGAIPTWNNYVAHPNYDAFWQKQAVTPYVRKLRLTVPNLNVAGWWDQEDFYGPVTIYEALEKHDPNHLNYLVAGPWNHGGWAHGTGRSLGEIDFGSNTSEYFREKIQAQWFAHWLKDEGQMPFKEALTFQTGSNQWQAYDQWPPGQNVTERKLYVHASGVLSFNPPADRDESPGYDSYLSDPANPVPYRRRPMDPTYPCGDWCTWLVQDQRFASFRPDTLTWESKPLTQDVSVAGDIVAHLYAATMGTDSDFVAKLIDVYPEVYPQDPKLGGFELMIANDVFRARFRKSFVHPQPMTPGKVTPITIDLHTNNHRFLKGHRIMVQVQSTWFPVIDRNPQTFVPNIFKAEPADFKKATELIYHTSRYPTNIEVPVVGP